MALLSLRIHILTKPHSDQRYDTCGDWLFDKQDGSLIIYVSNLGDWKQELCVAVHELIEAMLCKDLGITDELVTEFDEDFESKRVEGNTDEPGDSPDAPYKAQHFFATSLERLLAAELGVDWKEYEEAINNL
jgi:hypothetical protein